MTQTQDKQDKQDNQDRRGLGLSPAQVAGSALAAMSGAFFASFAGVAGTLIGAAAVSVFATVGTATYTWWLRRSSAVVRRTAVELRQRALLTGAVPRPGDVARDAPVPDPNAPSPAATLRDAGPDEPPASEGVLDGEATRSRFDLPWTRLALASLVVLLASLAGITAIEAITGKPIASLLGKDEGTGTTFGRVVGTDGSSSDQDRPPGRVTPTTPDPDPAPTNEPSPAPEQPVPSPTPEPTGSPSIDVEPSEAPAETPAPLPGTVP